MTSSFISAFISLAILATSVTASQPLGQRASYAGKMTWIGPTTGAYTSCGSVYQDSSMYVAVAPSVHTCGTGAGVPMTITCNGQTIQAMAADTCVGCDADHIDVATAVYEACGFNTGDGGMQDSGISWSF